MAVVPKLRPEEIEEIGDITFNLQSLLFESALTEEEKQLLHLRKRSHALTVCACAQATYFVSILNEARQVSIIILILYHVYSVHTEEFVVDYS